MLKKTFDAVKLKLTDLELFNENAIRKALKNQNAGGKNYSRYLYRMLSVELWFREFID
jgi:hypothetical protein